MVRCADCGFLANRNFETGELVSVDEGRQTGRFRTLLGVTYGPMPTCFRMKANLFAEYLTEKSENRLLAVITKDRGECAGFVKWEPGFTPKEHREMLFDLEREKLAADDRKEKRRWHERRDRRQLIGLLLAAIVGVALHRLRSRFTQLATGDKRQCHAAGHNPARTTRPALNPSTPAY